MAEAWWQDSVVVGWLQRLRRFADDSLTVRWARAVRRQPWPRDAAALWWVGCATGALVVAITRPEVTALRALVVRLAVLAAAWWMLRPLLTRDRRGR